MRHDTPTITWHRCRTYDEASIRSECLYVFSYSADLNDPRPFYIGIAKRFGGISRSRYNRGYSYLIDGLLDSGFELYLAEIGPTLFKSARHYEQYLINEWNPIANKRRKSVEPWILNTTKPWSGK